jgi:hypothetical protein
MKRSRIWHRLALLLLCHGFAMATLAAPQTAGQFITLVWTPATQPDGDTVAGWNVYRSTVSGGPYTWLASVPVATPTYIDSSVVAGDEYFYVVTSVDTAGVESAYSASTDATVPVPLSVATTSLPSTLVGATYSFVLSAAGGNPPYTWAGSGVPGLTVSSAGLLSGTATQSGTFTSLLTVTDSTSATASTSIPVIVAAPPLPPAPSFPSGLVLYWPLDAADSIGGVAVDTSGNSNAGTIVGNPLSVAGQLTQALYFGNSASYITGTQYTGIFSTSLTLAAWINTTVTSMEQTIFSKYSSGGSGAGYVFSVNQTGNLTMRIGWTDLLSSPNRATDTTMVADGNWHHVVATISFESQTIQFYVDGQPTSSAAMNMVPNGDGGATLQLGANSQGWWPDYFTGSIDGVQVYNRALSGSEVNSVFLLTGRVGN